jgi:flagellar biogenesis protein FliO
MKKINIIQIVIAFFCLINIGFANDQLGFAQNDNYGSSIFKIYILLFGLIIIALIALFILKKKLPKKFDSQFSEKQILVLEKKRLSPKLTVHLIEIENEKFLIAEHMQSVEIKNISQNNKLNENPNG